MGLSKDQVARSVWALTPDGRRLEGARAVSEALSAARLPAAAALFRLPGAEPAYRWAAGHRGLLDRLWH